MMLDVAPCQTQTTLVKGENFCLVEPHWECDREVYRERGRKRDRDTQRAKERECLWKRQRERNKGRNMSYRNYCGICLIEIQKLREAIKNR